MRLKTPLTVKSGNFISTAKSDSGFVCMQRRSMSRIEQALGTEEVFGSAGIAPEENGHCPLQPALDPVHPASLASFLFRT